MAIREEHAKARQQRWLRCYATDNLWSHRDLPQFRIGVLRLRFRADPKQFDLEKDLRAIFFESRLTATEPATWRREPVIR